MSDNNADFNGAGQVNNPTSDNAAQADYNQPYIPQQNDAQMNHPESQPETPAYDQNSAAYTQTAQSAQTAQPSYGQPATPAPAYGTAPVYTQPAQPATPAAPVYDPNAASYNQYGQYDQPSQPAQSAQPSYGQPAAPAYDPNNAYAQPDYNQANYGQQGYAAPFYNQSAYTQPAYAAPSYNQSAYTQPAYAQQPAYGQPVAPAGYAQKSKLAAGLLGIFLGCFGVHNFYLGNTGKAVAQLLLTVIGWILIIGPAVAGIWGLVEGILILCSHYGSQWHRDAQGVELQD
ncbi:TM2 domain-containing protein [uncultured Bifidobacterium sp.]|uniref:TM2 domain-containing protein n=1 Tax=uncultured Bifidobacterium sp. TaxID=165187 RepID=UPI002598C1EC|nr:TM2 domain-containing protein [uncultured Bifidobacterium sp.]